MPATSPTTTFTCCDAKPIGCGGRVIRGGESPPAWASCLSTMMVWARSYHLGTANFSPEIATPQRRGRMEGEKHTLSSEQEFLLRRYVVKDRPETHGLPYALWTRRAVQEIIRINFDVAMSIRTVGEYLVRWRMTLQRPALRAQEQDQAVLQSWTSETYPELVKHAKAQSGAVYWADETAIHQDMSWIHQYAPIRQTPRLIHSARWDSIKMISAVTNLGLVRFRLHDGSFNAERFIEFLQGLIDNAQQKVFLILDNLRVYHAKLVRQWVKERGARIGLHYLPQYPSEAN